jgi:hypothetical protein
MSSASDAGSCDRPNGRRQAMLRQLLIMLASVAAALTAANFGNGGGP